MRTLLCLVALTLLPVSMPVRAQDVYGLWKADGWHQHVYTDSGWITEYLPPRVDTVYVHDTVYVDTCKSASQMQNCQHEKRVPQ